MGPHPERCGYFSREGGQVGRLCASMGPHPERCGYDLQLTSSGDLYLASMGPHPERCGYLLFLLLLKLCGVLQWGHTPKGVDTAG